MPEVTSIFPQDEAKKVIEVGNAITQADNALLKYTQDLDALIEKLNKENVSFKDIIEVQKKVAKTTEDIDRVGKKLAQSEQNLIEIQDKRQKQIISNREETKKHTRELQLNDKATKALKGSYDAISASLSKNLVKYKNMSAAQRDNSKAGKTLETTIKKQRDELAKLDSRLGNHTRNVGNYRGAIVSSARSLLGAFGLVGGIAMFARVMKDAFGTIRNFTKENAVLAGVLGTTRDNVQELTDQAVQLGSIYPVTASEVTKLQVSYARLGFTQSEIINLTEATIQGSIALNSSLDKTATLVGAVVKAFNNLGTQDSGKVIDILTKATQRSSLSFESLEVALPKVAAAANALNIDLETVSAQLGVAQDATLDASISGTSLRNIYLELSKRGLTLDQALSQINNSSNRLNESFELFGKRGAIVGLALADNIEKTSELEGELRNAGGTAKRVAEEQMNTLDGSIKNLASSWEKLILGFRKSEGFFKKVTDSAASLVDVISEEKISRWTKYWNVLTLGIDKTANRQVDSLKRINTAIGTLNSDQLQKYLDNYREQLEAEGKFGLEKIKVIEEGIENKKTVEENAEKDRKKREEIALKQAELEKLAIQREANEKAAKEKEKADKKLNEGLIRAAKTAENEKNNEIIQETEDFIDWQDDQIQARLDNEIEANIEATKQILKTREELAEKEDKIREDQKKKEEEDLIQKAKLYQEFTDIVANAFFDFTQGNKDALKEGAKAIVITALEVLKAQTQVAIAGATIQSLAQPDSVATFGLAGLARAAVLAGLIEVAFASVEGLVQGFAVGTENAPGRFVAGEKGRELMYLKTGEVMMVDRPTYFEGNKFKGATIKTNAETERIISEANKNNNFVFDTSDLKNEMIAVRKAIQKKPVSITDSSGRITGVKSESYREDYLSRLKR